MVLERLSLSRTILVCITLMIAAASASVSVASDEAPVQKPNDGFSIIVHPSNPTASLSLNETRAIFSLRARQWENGSAITVVVLEEDHQHHADFLRKNLKMLPHQLRRQWDRFIYSGLGQGPKIVSSEEELMKIISQEPGSIGYISSGVPHATAKALAIH